MKVATDQKEIKELKSQMGRTSHGLGTALMDSRDKDEQKEVSTNFNQGSKMSDPVIAKLEMRSLTRFHLGVHMLTYLIIYVACT